MTITRNIHPPASPAWLAEVYRAGRFLDPTYKVPLGQFEPTLTYVGLVAALKFAPRSLREAGLDHRTFLERHDFRRWLLMTLNKTAFIAEASPLRVITEAAEDNADRAQAAADRARASRDAAKRHGPRGKGKRS